MKEDFAIAIHGGAGTISQSLTADARQPYEEGLKQALEAGIKVLLAGGSSLEAVEAAVTSLEDCPLFNAGRGAVFNDAGYHEMDAAIMNGKTLAAGAVASVSGVKNPIQLARAVMEKSDYVFLCGAGAQAFARKQELPVETDEYFHTDFRYKEWQQEKKEKSAAKHKLGTVGAVALDRHGNLAAATSTGGLTNKKYSRVGDSPVIGGGTYANNNTCAVSCTGDGEQFIRMVVAYDISCLMEYKNYSLHEACETVMKDKLPKIAGSGGLIAIDPEGNIEMPFNTEGMYRACYRPDGTWEVKIFND